MSDIVTVARTLLTHVNAPDGWVFMGHEGSFPLEIRDTKTFNEVVTLKDDINDMGETIAQMPSVIAQLVDALESQRVAVRLEWRSFYGSERLHLLIGRVDHPILTVDPEDWLLSIYTRPGHADVRPERTREEVLAAVKTHVESLEIPCVVPPFPEITDAS